MNQAEEYGLFFKALHSLAKICKFDLDEDTLDLYERHLASLGFKAVAFAIEDIAANRKTNEPFPSIREIREKIIPEVSNKSVADDVANRLIAAFKKHGSNWGSGYFSTSHPNNHFFEARTPEGVKHFDTFQEAFLAECGEVAWQTVQRMGGYSSVCGEWGMSENPSAFRAQLRDMVQSIMEQAKAGKLNTPPALPEPQNKKLLENNGPKSIGHILQNTLKALPKMPEGEK